MYPISLGFEEVCSRLDRLSANGHHAECLLATVFAFEKMTRRALRFLMLSRGLSSRQCDALGNGLKWHNIKELWPIFERDGRTLSAFIGNNVWQHVPPSITKRNEAVHGGRVYEQAVYMEAAARVRAALVRLREQCLNEYKLDPWMRLPQRARKEERWDVLMQIKK